MEYTFIFSCSQASPGRPLDPLRHQPCQVCGAPAAGFHFGAFTCEGCKSFYGRNYKRASSELECKSGHGCTIDARSRTSCRACRMRKCLAAGMSPDGSRFGRWSNWFKVHCLVQQQRQQTQQLGGEAKRRRQDASEGPRSRVLPQEETIANSIHAPQLLASLSHGGSTFKVSPSQPATETSPAPPPPKLESLLSSLEPLSPIPTTAPSLLSLPNLLAAAFAASAAAAAVASAAPLVPSFPSLPPPLPSPVDLTVPKQKAMKKDDNENVIVDEDEEASVLDLSK